MKSHEVHRSLRFLILYYEVSLIIIHKTYTSSCVYHPDTAGGVQRAPTGSPEPRRAIVAVLASVRQASQLQDAVID